MLDKISQMPDNSENYLRKGINALKNNQIDLGTYYLEQSYQIKPLIESFVELCKIYIELDKSTKLQDLWQKSGYSFDEICHSSQLAPLYGRSLPIMQTDKEALIELYMLKDNQNNKQNKHIFMEAINLIQFKIKVKNDSVNLLNKERYQKILTNFTQKNYFQQLLYLKELYLFPINQTLIFYKDVLVQENILNYVKSDIIHYLLKENYSEEVDLVWFKQNSRLQLQNLSAYYDTPFFIENLKYLENYLDKHNPHLKEEAVQLFTLHMMVYYPFMKEGLNDINNWIEWLESGNLNDSQQLKTYQLAAKELDSLFHIQ